MLYPAGSNGELFFQKSEWGHPGGTDLGRGNVLPCAPRAPRAPRAARAARAPIVTPLYRSIFFLEQYTETNVKGAGVLKYEMAQSSSL